MDKTFCDMCTREFCEKDYVGGVYISSHGKGTDIDLCPKCWETVRHFIEAQSVDWSNEGRER